VLGEGGKGRPFLCVPVTQEVAREFKHTEMILGKLAVNSSVNDVLKSERNNND
jgi:hypothetical protein